MAEYVVVIDPGHGSETYPGGHYDGYVEKDIDLVVASVMKDRLEKYDNVKVYMTRYDDSNVELHDRAKIADFYDADLFVSIHFNMSADHDLYGAEVWIPAQNEYYKEVYPLAVEMMKNFDAIGLHNRGIKTRLNSDGTDNYYAVLRDATNYGIPSILVEHCHMDNPMDTFAIPIYDTQAYLNNLNNFGIQDADAVAKYLHLKSTSLGVDYSKYKLTQTNTKKALISQDYTAPESCTVNLVSTNAADSTITVNITASDSDGFIQYYRYSIDGGAHWSYMQDWPRTTWNKSAPSCQTTIKVKEGSPTSLVVFVYNGYDLVTAGNILNVQALTGASQDKEANLTVGSVTSENQSLEKASFTGLETESLTAADLFTEKTNQSGMLSADILIMLSTVLAGLVTAGALFIHGIKRK